MASRIKKSDWLPPRDLIQRRLRMLARLLRKEAKDRSPPSATRAGELTVAEMKEWAEQIERLLR